MGVSATKGDRRRERILDAVRELLQTQSFDDLSIAEITRRADVTRPGFYFYFQSKGAAVASLMEALFPEFMAAATVWYEHAEVDQRRGIEVGMAATVELWRRHAVVMNGMVQAAAVDLHAGRIWEQWVNAFAGRAVPTISSDRPRARTGPTAEQLAVFLVDATFAAMERDVRSIVTSGFPVHETLETLVFAWTQTLYADLPT